MNRGADILTGLLHHVGEAAERLHAVRETLAGLSDADFDDVLRELAAEPESEAATILSNFTPAECQRRRMLTPPADA